MLLLLLFCLLFFVGLLFLFSYFCFVLNIIHFEKSSNFVSYTSKERELGWEREREISMYREKLLYVCMYVFVGKFRNKAFPQLSGRYDIKGGALGNGYRYTRSFPQSTLHQVNCNGSPRFGYLAGRRGPPGALYTHSYLPTYLLPIYKSLTPYISLITRTFQQGDYYMEVDVTFRI